MQQIPRPAGFAHSRPSSARLGSVLAIAGSFAIALLPALSFAQTTYTWIRTNASAPLWGDTANWQGGSIADGVGAIANFSAIQAGSTRTVGIDTVSRTVGILNLLNQHNTATSNQSYTFATTSGQTLTFDNGASNAQLNITNGPSTGGGTNTFSVGVLLGSSLDIANNRTLATNTLTFSGSISASSVGTKTLSNIGTGTANVTISGAISDGSGIVAVRQASASGTLILSGTNSHTGGTYIDAGTLSVSSLANLGDESGGIHLNGGTLLFTVGVNTSGYNPVTEIGASGGTINTVGFVNWFGELTGTGALHKTGSSTLSINAANNFTGGIFVDAGSFRANHADGFGGDGNVITFANGTTFLNGTSQVATSAGRTLALASGNVTFNISNPLTWQGAISGDGGFTKTGSSTITLSGTNTYKGNTVISAGTVSFSADANLGDAASIVVLNGGTLQLDGSSLNSNRALSLTAASTIQTDTFLNWSGVVSGTGNITKTGSNTLSFNNADNTFTGDILVNAGTFRIRGGDGALGNAANNLVFASGTTFGNIDNFAAGAGRTLTLTSGNVNFSPTQTAPGFEWQGTVTGAGGLTKAGAGVLTLSGAANYTGGTTVSAGTLSINGDFTTATGNYAVNAGKLNVGSSGQLSSGSSVSVAAGATFAYHNNTQALASTVSLAGAGLSSRAIFGGDGTVASALTLDNLGDTLAPGSSPGTLTFSTGQTWDSFSYDWEVNDFTGTTAGTAFDQIVVDGVLSLSATGSYQLNLLSLTVGNLTGNVANFGEVNRQWNILTATGGILNFDSALWTISTTGFTSEGGYLGTFALDKVGNDLVLSYTAIPEPSTYALLAGVLTLGLAAWRRSRGVRA